MAPTSSLWPHCVTTFCLCFRSLCRCPFLLNCPPRQPLNGPGAALTHRSLHLRVRIVSPYSLAIRSDIHNRRTSVVRVYVRCRISSAARSPQSDVHFNKILKWFLCTFNCELLVPWGWGALSSQSLAVFVLKIKRFNWWIHQADFVLTNTLYRKKNKSPFIGMNRFRSTAYVLSQASFKFPLLISYPLVFLSNPTFCMKYMNDCSITNHVCYFVLICFSNFFNTNWQHRFARFVLWFLNVVHEKRYLVTV